MQNISPWIDLGCKRFHCSRFFLSLSLSDFVVAGVVVGVVFECACMRAHGWIGRASDSERELAFSWPLYILRLPLSYYLSKDICRFVVIYELLSRFKPLNSGHIHYRNKSNVLVLWSVRSLWFFLIVVVVVAGFFLSLPLTLISFLLLLPYFCLVLFERHGCVDFAQLSALRIKFIQKMRKASNKKTLRSKTKR